MSQTNPSERADRGGIRTDDGPRTARQGVRRPGDRRGSRGPGSMSRDALTRRRARAVRPGSARDDKHEPRSGVGRLRLRPTGPVDHPKMSDAEVRTDEGFQGCRFDRRPESLERATHQAEMGRAYDRGVAAGEVAERAWPHRDEGRILGSVEARPKTEAFQESDDGPEGFTCLGPRLTE